MARQTDFAIAVADPSERALAQTPYWRHDVVPDDIEFGITSASTAAAQMQPVVGKIRRTTLSAVVLAEESLAAQIEAEVAVMFGAGVAITTGSYSYSGGMTPITRAHELDIEPALPLDIDLSFARDSTAPTVYGTPLKLDYSSVLWDDVNEVLVFPSGQIEVKQIAPFASVLSREPDAILSAIKTLPRHGKAIVARLSVLLAKQDEEELDATDMSVDSLQSFWKFLAASRGIKLPAISLTPDGNLYVSWREPNGRMFSIHFLPGDEARYVLFRPVPGKPVEKLRSTGAAPADLILRIPETASASWVFS